MSWTTEEKALLGLLLRRQTLRQTAAELRMTESEIRVLVKRFLAKLSASVEA